MSRNKQIEEVAKCCTCHHNGECCADTANICACDLMCEMFGVFANLENAGYRKQEWISVDERLPESSCECLVATNIGGIYQVNYSHRYKAFNSLDTDEAKYAMITVTHWMPLPQPPMMKGGAE